jgi:hypothetical protein
MLESLTAALSRGSLESARALVAPITQFYLIQRPTLNLSLKQSQIHVTRTTLSVRIGAITTGRKNKQGSTLLLLRAVPTGQVVRAYPIPILFAYRALLFREHGLAGSVRPSTAGLGMLFVPTVPVRRSSPLWI